VTTQTDVRTIAIYLDEIIGALRGQGFEVENGFVGANLQSGRSITVTLGACASSLSHATLAWQPAIGWSLTSRQARPRQWILPLNVLAAPEAVARAIRDLTATLGSSPGVL
jgi:hypothetical protein